MEKTICVSGESLTLPEINKRLDEKEREKQEAFYNIGIEMISLERWKAKALTLVAECAELEKAFRALMKLYDIEDEEDANNETK